MIITTVNLRGEKKSIVILPGKMCVLFYGTVRLFASVYIGCGWLLQAVGYSVETADWLTQRADGASHPN